ncbi:TonB-dependent receptor [Hasllibacter sp. MH4015]|uniref:transporter n=1 Tax=Hasllibacter sp. MH4015 TaxID=2854029 RepID=UPI001CD27865|nr:TonB-dependent receptor [Hasllibacter sp. MH4015]
MGILSPTVQTWLASAVILALAAPAMGQGLQVGDEFIAIDATSVTREDLGTERNATTLMATHGYQFSGDWQVLTQIGFTRNENRFPPADTQHSDATSLALGLSYTGFTGGTATAMVIYGRIEEESVIGGSTTTGSGDLLGLSLSYQQIVPLSDRLAAIGLIAYSTTDSDFTSAGAGVMNDITGTRFTLGATLAYSATPDLTILAGVDHAASNQIITITGSQELTRATLGASWSLSPDLDLRASYGHAINAEQTHNRLSLGLTRRF